MTLTRSTKNFTFTIAAGSDTSEAVDVGPYAWGSIQLPPELDGDNTRFFGSIGGAFVTCRDAEGDSPATIPFVASGIVNLPIEVLSCCAFKVNVDAVQTEERVFRVNLKS